jgi:Domain of unknown function (DUF4337)
MDTLEKELNDLKGFIAELKSDRAAQKEKEKRESWTKYTSMSLVFIAVLAAIATQWGGKYSSRVLVEMNNATLCQTKASDNWNYYQADSIKQNLYDSLLKSSLAGSSAGAPDADKFKKDFEAKIAKYNDSKATNRVAAETLEKQRDQAKANASNASQHGSGMGLAVAVFQISIAMGSICLVTKKKWLWYVSILLALVATGRMLLVWLA